MWLLRLLKLPAHLEAVVPRYLLWVLEFLLAVNMVLLQTMKV